ncbi:EXS family-domain-containing protein [Cunninghamella echinulata]|nr:EXS family-domain-containing protein [Cunninghamella echinulata]
MDTTTATSYLPGTYRPIVLICIGLCGWGLDLLLLCRQRIDPAHLLQIHSNDSKPIYHSIFILASVLSIMVFLNLWFYLQCYQKSEASWLPFIAYFSAILFLFWPGQSFYKKERKRFIRLVKRICSFNLFSTVYFVDIIFADFLTSFSNVFGDFFLTLCIILNGKSSDDFDLLEANRDNAYYRDIMVPLVISLPYIIRLRQCMSEYIESRGETKRHLFNALKYASAFPAIILSALQKKVAFHIMESGSVPTTWWINESNIFRLWMMAVFINSMYSFWWDISMDWNLLQITYDKSSSATTTIKHKSTIMDHHHHTTSTLPMIRFRRHLHFSSTTIYFLAMILDFVLRITWSMKLSSHIYIQHIEGSVFLVELLEVFRRWVWVLFRMESEWVKRSSLPTSSNDNNTSIRMDLMDRPKMTLLTPIREEDNPLE